jgi:hypothetical protein
LKSKAKDNTLLKELHRLQEENISIKNYETLKQHVPEATFTKLIKGIDI